MKLVKKSDSRLMRSFGWILGDDFLGRFWTTFGGTVYVPRVYDHDPDWGFDSWLERHSTVLAHEGVHLEQFRRLSVLGTAVVYIGPAPFLLPFALISPWVLIAVAALLPLSVGLAFGRWWIEREAYLVNVCHGEDIDWIVDTLATSYFRPWPKSWMRKWLHKHSQSCS